MTRALGLGAALTALTALLLAVVALQGAESIIGDGKQWTGNPTLDDGRVWADGKSWQH